MASRRGWGARPSSVSVSNGDESQRSNACVSGISSPSRANTIRSCSPNNPSAATVSADFGDDALTRSSVVS
jgi:hypothetical protein